MRYFYVLMNIFVALVFSQYDVHAQNDVARNPADLAVEALVNQWDPDDIFSINLEERIINKEYKNLTDISSATDYNLKNMESLEVNTTIERQSVKDALVGALSDLSWRLKVPLYEVDSKIILLRSYLKSLLSYYRQIKDKKETYDKLVKTRTLGLVQLLYKKYSHLPREEMNKHVQEAMLSRSDFKNMVSDFHAQNQRYRSQASVVVTQIREVDLAITKLKEKRLELEMGIVSRQMSDRVDSVLTEVSQLNAAEVADKVSAQYAEDVNAKSESVNVTDEAIADFLINMGVHFANDNG